VELVTTVPLVMVPSVTVIVAPLSTIVPVKTVFALTSFAARATDPSGSRAPLAASQMATESLLLLSVNRIVTEVDAPVQPTARGRLRRGAGDVSGAGSGGARAMPDRRGAGDARSALRAPASQPCGLSAFRLLRG
jgi:hypothetical protein